MSFLISALGILVVFGLVIFVHEFGHFIVAKKTGIKVERFSFGLGPELCGFQWGETRYCLAWIPLGGEVRMAGDMEFEESKKENAEPPKPKDPRDFFAQPWYRRIPVILAGPGMNYVLAFFLFAFIAFVWGIPTASDKPVIGDLMEGFPAHQAKLQTGDLFLSIDNTPVDSWTALAGKIHQSPDKPVTVVVQRGHEEITVSLTPKRDERLDVGLIGITPSVEYIKAGFFQSMGIGVKQCVGWTVFTLKYLGNKIVRREKPDLAGPIGIANVVAKATKSGMKDFIYLIALISVGIGLFNLFPIPILDGGHLMFFLWEGIARKPASAKAMQRANAIGLSLLLGILVFATYSDIQRMIVSKKMKNVQQENSQDQRP